MNLLLISFHLFDHPFMNDPLSGAISPLYDSSVAIADSVTDTKALSAS